MADFEEASQLLYGIGDGSITKDDLTLVQKRVLMAVFNDLMGHISAPEAAPYARLISAAPDLLDAAKSVFCECSPLYECSKNCFMHKIEKAIAKAEGD